MFSFKVIAAATIALVIAAFTIPLSNSSAGIEIGLAVKLWKEAGVWLAHNQCDVNMTAQCMAVTAGQYIYLMIGTMCATKAYFLSQEGYN